MVSCQKGPTRHAYTWQIRPFSQDTLVMRENRTDAGRVKDHRDMSTAPNHIS